MITLSAKTENVTTLRIGLLPALLVAALCSSCGGDPQPEVKPEVPADAKTILTNLGVKEVNSPPAPTYTTTVNNKQVTVDPTTWQPLKTPTAVFRPRAELLQIGVNVGNYWNAVYTDMAASPPTTASNPITDDQSWEKSAIKTAVSADLDGDGIDEATIFYVKDSDATKLYYRIYQGQAVSAERSIDTIALSGQKMLPWTTTSRSGIGTPWFPFLSSTKADVDGDGKSEIILIDYKSVYVLSSNSGEFTVKDAKNFDSPVSSVAGGDLDGDRQDELVVGFLGNGAQYAIFDSSFDSPITNPAIQTLDPYGTFVEAAFGDFRGNNLEQLALSTYLTGGPNAGKVATHMFDLSLPPESAMTETRVLYVSSNPLGAANTSGNDYFRMLPRAVDLKGTGTQQLYVAGSIFSDPMRSDTHSDIWSAFTYVSSDNTIADVQVGDANNDAKQDLYFLTIGQSGCGTIQVLGNNDNDTFVQKKPLVQSSSQCGPDNFGTATSIAVGHFEDNSPRVHYVGHKLTFTDPIVIATLASPPYWAEINDSGYQGAYTNWLTSFGTISSTETENSNSVGFSVGASVEYEHDVETPIFGIKIASFKASAEFTNTNTWEWASTHEVETSIQYTCSGGQDCVIFTSVPMDEYEYKIDTSNDPQNKVGSSLYISIPRSYSTYTVTRDFFNANIGENVILPIDDAVFQHRLGAPLSYPTSDQKDALLAKYSCSYQAGATPVSQGPDSMPNSGTTNLQITVSDGNSKTIQHDFSFVGKVGAGVGDWTFSVSAGFNTGYSATTTTTTGTQFGGTVGYLPTAYYANPNYAYTSGVFAYPYQASNGKSFWVVDYWVE